MPKDLPKEYEGIYEELHSKNELEELRGYYGNGILNELYHLEFADYRQDSEYELED